MIIGQVNAKLEPRVTLYVEDGAGQTLALEPTIDTGYSCFLTLPSAMIANLAIPWIGDRRFMLGDGSIKRVDVYSCVVIWDGQPRTVDVDEIDIDPVVGMKMLAGHEVRIRVVDGGLVWIDLVP